MVNSFLSHISTLLIPDVQAMKQVTICIFVLGLLLLSRPISAIEPAKAAADVVVYGATPAGIAAAIAAAEGNHSVQLIEPTARIGGMMTHGLSHSDFHTFEAINGFFDRFSGRVLKHYQTRYGPSSLQAADSWRGTHGEPSVNLLVFQTMLAECPSVTVITGHRLRKVMVQSNAITGVQFEGGGGRVITVKPRLCIDATYEGDLMAAAGVPYRIGREARSEYKESLAPDVADSQLQGYNFRLCMTQKESNRVAVPMPNGYNRADYAAIVPLVESGKIPTAFGYPGKTFLFKAHLPIMPNGKHDINDVSNGLVRLSMPGHQLGFPEGDPATRRRIEQKHLDWQRGLIHFAQTDSALPTAFREEAATWGLCRDEFTETDNIPTQIYVREARRMVGQHIYTENDTESAKNDARAKRHSDSIAMGEYSHNCHGTDHEGPMIVGKHTGEFSKGAAPYQIPYGVMVPRKLTNLLVPVACSSSHVGFCALRLEPIWMSLGEVAGLAASQVLDREVPVQQVDVSFLQSTIWQRGGATIHASDVPSDHNDFIVVQWWGNVGGLHGLEPALQKAGMRGAHIVSQYFEAFPGHAVQVNKPLADELAAHWNQVALGLNLSTVKLPAADGRTTRGDWIRAAYAASRQ